MRLYDKFSTVKLKSFSSPKQSEGKKKEWDFQKNALLWSNQSLQSKALKIITTNYNSKL